MLLWCDGFDHYGTTMDNMLDGPYAANGNSDAFGNSLLTSAQAATGTRSYYMNTNTGLTTFIGLRKVLPAATSKMGAAARFYFPGLPSFNYVTCIFNFLTASPNTSQLACFVDSNGAIRFVRGANNAGSDGNVGSGTVVAQTDPILTANAWNHVEVQVNIHATLGWVRVAVNGVHRFQATGLNTLQNSDQIVSVGQNRSYLNVSGSFYMDDYILYDFTGNSAVETDFCPTTDGAGIATQYIANLQCMYLPPNANTAQDAWTKSTGVSAFALVDETDPDDTDYIYSTGVGNLTELGLTDLPPEITYVRGVQLLGRLSKADAGAAGTKFGMKSVVTSLDAAERPVTVEPTFWWDFSNVDPNTTAATGILTFTNQPANNETVTIGTKTYTFQTVLTNVDGNVLIGANTAASISNLAAAINLGAGSGTAYAAATTANTQVAATAGATTLTITALVGGTAANSIATTETITNASWGGATMSGGNTTGARWTRTSLNAAWIRLIRSL